MQYSLVADHWQYFCNHRANRTRGGWNHLGLWPVGEEKRFPCTGFQCNFVANFGRFDLAANLQL